MRDRRGWVYAVGAQEVRTVKIGFSHTPTQRVRDLTSGSPVELHILAKRRGTFKDERALHARLAAHRAHGEWFRLEGEVLVVIEEMKRRPRQAPREMWPDGTSRKLTNILICFGSRPRDATRLRPYLEPRPAGAPLERVAVVWRPRAARLGVHETWLEP